MRVIKKVWSNKIPKTLEFSGVQYEIPHNKWLHVMKIVIEQLLTIDEKLMMQ